MLFLEAMIDIERIAIARRNGKELNSKMSGVIRNMARPLDEKTADTTFYRIGGEEFALIIEKKRSKQSDGRPSTSTITPFKVRIPYEREYSKGACRWGNISIHRLLFGFKRHTGFGRPEISQIIFRGRDNTLVGKGSPIASVFC